MDRAETGRKGEAVAAKHYLNLGYRLLAHNYRTRLGELDLVLEHAGTVVICEVKTRSPKRIARPAAAVDRNKQRKLILAAQQYLQTTGRLDCAVRFDVAEVTPLADGKWQVHLIKSAFECE